MAPANGREPKNLNFVTTILGSTLLEKQLQFGKGETVPEFKFDIKGSLELPCSDFNSVFLLQTDSNDATDAISGDLKFAVDSEKVGAGQANGVIPFSNTKILVEDSGLTAADKASLSDQDTITISHEAAAWCVRTYFGAGGLDIIDNEADLHADIVSKDPDLTVKLKEIIKVYGGNPSAPREHRAVASDDDHKGPNSCNYAREFYISALREDPEELANRLNDVFVSRSSVKDFVALPIYKGDTLTMYIVHGSKNQLVDSAGTTINNPGKRTAPNGYLFNEQSINPAFQHPSATAEDEFNFDVVPTYGPNIEGSFTRPNFAAADAHRVYQITINFVGDDEYSSASASESSRS